jgi:hypothetical protein
MRTSWLRLDSHKIPSRLKLKRVILQLLRISHSFANQMLLCRLMAISVHFVLPSFITQDRAWNIFNIKNCSIAIPLVQAFVLGTTLKGLTTRRRHRDAFGLHDTLVAQQRYPRLPQRRCGTIVTQRRISTTTRT